MPFKTNEYLTAESTAITAVENGNIVNSLNYKQLFDEVFVIHCIWNNQG